MFKLPISIAHERAVEVVKALCCLHNYFRNQKAYYTDADFDREDRHGEVSPGAWRCETNHCLTPLIQSKGRQSDIAKAVRNTYKHYFNIEGAVDWQEKIVFRRT